MESTAFRRSDAPASSGNMTPDLVSEQYRHATSPTAAVERQTTATPDVTRSGPVKRELTAIREELEVLKERRQALEAQRNRLLAATLPPRAAPGALPRRSDASHAGEAPSEHSVTRPYTAAQLYCADASGPPSVGNTHQSSRASSHPHWRSERGATPGTSALVNCQLIPSEAQRRHRLETNPYSEMKSRLRESCEQDSMCRMGTFLLEDNSRVFTFGRERRFRPLPGEKEEYYLGANKQVKQELNRRGQRRSQSMRDRLALLDETPGPGAYTPLYAKQSRPSVLTSLYY